MRGVDKDIIKPVKSIGLNLDKLSTKYFLENKGEKRRDKNGFYKNREEKTKK